MMRQLKSFNTIKKLKERKNEKRKAEEYHIEKERRQRKYDEEKTT